MSIRRSLHLSLLLSLTSACTIDKGPLDSSSSSDGASESAEATSTPTTSGASPGDATTGTSTGQAGTSTDVGTGSATTIDIDTNDTGVATTTGGPDDSELVVFPAGEPLCMPVCVQDEDLSTPVVEPNCELFAIDVDADSKHELMPCEEVQFEWIIPAGQVRCYAELIDNGNQTPSKNDQIGETCLATGFNLEFLIVESEPAPPGVVFGAICEPSHNPALACPDA